LDWNDAEIKEMELAMRDMKRYQYCHALESIPGVSELST